MNTQKVRNTRTHGRNSFIVILIITGIVLFRLFIWDTYIVNSTVDDALEGYQGEPGTGMFIDQAEKHNITIKPVPEGFKVYGVSKGFWGWKVTHDLLIQHPELDSVKVTEEKLHYTSKDVVHVIFIPTPINFVDRIEAFRDNGEPIAFNSMVNGDTRLYYYYSEQPIGEVEYKALSKDGTQINVN